MYVRAEGTESISGPYSLNLDRGNVSRGVLTGLIAGFSSVQSCQCHIALRVGFHGGREKTGCIVDVAFFFWHDPMGLEVDAVIQGDINITIEDKLARHRGGRCRGLRTDACTGVWNGRGCANGGARGRWALSSGFRTRIAADEIDDADDRANQGSKAGEYSRKCRPEIPEAAPCRPSCLPVVPGCCVAMVTPASTGCEVYDTARFGPKASLVAGLATAAQPTAEPGPNRSH
jgi:hypothetical protein